MCEGHSDHGPSWRPFLLGLAEASSSNSSSSSSSSTTAPTACSKKDAAGRLQVVVTLDTVVPPTHGTAAKELLTSGHVVPAAHMGSRHDIAIECAGIMSAQVTLDFAAACIAGGFCVKSSGQDGATLYVTPNGRGGMFPTTVFPEGSIMERVVTAVEKKLEVIPGSSLVKVQIKIAPRDSPTDHDSATLHKDAAAATTWRSVLAADVYFDSLACVLLVLTELKYRASNSLFISDAESMADAKTRTVALHSRYGTKTSNELNEKVEESLRDDFERNGIVVPQRHHYGNRVEIAPAQPGFRRVVLAATPAVTASMPATTRVHYAPYILDCWTVFVPEFSSGERSISCYTMSPEARGAGLPDTAAGLMGSSPYDPTAATWMHAIGPFVF
jgi:hypothetical protein